MSKYLCLPCGYVYEEKNANEMQDDKLFVQKPVNWVCPDCGASKFDFERIEEK